MSNVPLPPITPAMVSVLAAATSKSAAPVSANGRPALEVNEEVAWTAPPLIATVPWPRFPSAETETVPPDIEAPPLKVFAVLVKSSVPPPGTEIAVLPLPS